MGAGTCVVYRTADWSQAAQWDGHNGGVNCVAWDPEGSRLASAGGDCLVRVWDPAAGTCLLTLRGHRSPVLSVAWEPGGRRLASASMDETVKVWPVPLVSQPRRLGGPGEPPTIAWGEEPGVLRAYSAKTGAVTVWDVATGQRRGQTPVVSGSFGQLSPGGRLVAVVTTGSPRRLLVCDARSGQSVQTVQTVKTTTSSWTVFSPDLSQLAVMLYGTLEIVDLRRNEVRFRWKGNGISAVSWSPDGRLLAIAGGGEEGWSSWVYVFDPDKGQRILKLHYGTAVAWSPDGRRLVSGDANGLAEVWEVPTGRKLASAQLHTTGIDALAWSPDGRRVASGGTDRTVRVWDPANGEELLRFDSPVAALRAMQWSPDGRRLAAAGADGTILIWDASAGYHFLNSEAYAREQARTRWKEADELWDRGQKAEALALFARALEMQKSTLGSDHDDTLLSMRELGGIYRTAGRLPEAVALLQQVLERRRAKLGPDHDDTLGSMNDLAVAYEDAGAFDRAEPLLADVLEHARKMDGPAAPQTAGVLASLGLSRLKQQKYAEAEPVLRECLAIREKAIPGHWLRFNALSLLGDALLGQKKYAEAEPLLLRGYDGMKQREATIPPPWNVIRLAEAAERLVRLYEATDEKDKAAEFQRKLDSLRKAPEKPDKKP
jgi:WD40 repeat protein